MGLNETGAFSLAACLLSFVIAVAPSLQKTSWWWPWSSEARLSTLLGLGTGALVLITYRIMHLDSPPLATEESQTFFFDFLLPFVIFNAGFSFKKIVFFANSGMILAFGILGTFVSFAIISAGVAVMIDWFNFQHDYVQVVTLADILRVGAVLAATDTVAILTVINQESYPLLYSLAFGEGVVNDAVSVVIVRVISDHENNLDLNAVQIMQLMGTTIKLFLGSIILGVVFGLITAFLVRNISDDKRHSAYEVSLMIVLAFMAYYFALMADMSGITTIFICGIMASHYTWHSLDDVGKIASKQFALMMSNGCEIAMFIITGLHSMDPLLWREVKTKHVVMLSVWMLILVMATRVIVVFPFSQLSNTWRAKDLQLNYPNQCCLAWGGLLRGSVSMALAYHEFRIHPSDTDDASTSPPMIAQVGSDAYSEGNSQADEFNDVHNIKSVFLASILVVVQFTIIVFGMLSHPILASLLEGDTTNKGVYNFKSRILDADDRPGDSAAIDLHRVKTMDMSEQRPLVPGGPGIPPTAPPPPKHKAPRYCGTIQIGRAWITFDRKYMQPIFGGRYAPDRVRNTPGYAPGRAAYSEIRDGDSDAL